MWFPFCCYDVILKMSAEDVEELNAEERLLQSHKRERKELQAKIQSLKHSVPKGDKKKKKEISAEIAKLECELSKKHETELADLKLNEINSIDQQLAHMTETTCLMQEKTPRITKAQKRRERKANKEREREQLIAQQEKENLKGARNVEAEKLKKILGEKHLAIYEVPSDGNCLYKAVEHQLSLQSISTTVEELRKLTSEYMLSHDDDFLPFLTNQNTDDMMTMDEFQQYCDDIIYTSAWGGQLELNALSHVYQLPIEIIQADGPLLIIGEEYKKSPLVLCYHRHIYGLGEHYNSTIAKVDIDDKAEL